MASIIKNYSISDDFKTIMSSCNDIFKELNNSHIFLTGGTGFIGVWILKSILYANTNMNLKIKVTILTRNIQSFANKFPDLGSYENFKYIEGDIVDFEYPNIKYDYIIHGATDASAELNEKHPDKMFSTIVDGTNHILKMSKKIKVKKFLYMSSGAVYGNQPVNMSKIEESWFGSVNFVDTKSAYAEGKRSAEMLCSIYNKKHNIDISIARIFALLGPYLTLGIHFAAGNFILDAINDRKVIVNGNGLPTRSYLYPTDLVISLFNLLIKKEEKLNPYNLGSDEAISIKELAEKISKLIGNGKYEVLDHSDSGWNLGRYVPDTNKFSKDFNINRIVSLDEAIIKTAKWNGWEK